MIPFLFTINCLTKDNNNSASGASPESSSPSAPPSHWAQSSTSGSNSFSFSSVVTDLNGNIFTSGSFYGTGTLSFSDSVSVAGTSPDWNLLIVKYNGSGSPVWARSVTAGESNSYINSITTDKFGNIYASGSIFGSGIYSFGNNVSLSGPTSSTNCILAKYNSEGEAQWAVSATSAYGFTSFNAVCCDEDENIYAAGYIYGTGTFSFGNGVTVTGVSNYSNLLLVKYNSSGIAQWAKTVTSSNDHSIFCTLAALGKGVVSAAGYLNGNGQFGFENSVYVAGSYSKGYNTLIAKYDANGAIQWVRSNSTGAGASYFNSIASDSSGNIIASGYIIGTSIYTFGNEVTANGSYYFENSLLVKYDINGNAQWAKSVESGSNASSFSSVGINKSGDIIAAGRISGTSPFSFGNNVQISGKYSGYNAFSITYSSSGNAQSAESMMISPNTSFFQSLSFDTEGNMFISGYIYGLDIYQFGNGSIVSGSCPAGNNGVVLKY
jgi:hypothetical protein